MSYIGAAVVIGIFAAGLADSIVNRIPAYSIEHDAALKSPYKYRAQLNASMRFIRQGLPAFGLAYAQNAVVIRPQLASGWINAAAAAGALEAWPLCYRYLQNALAICPARQLAENLIYVCRRLGKHESAHKLLGRLPEFAPELILNEPKE